MATEDEQRRYEIMRALIADVSERMAELYRAAAERRGEAPTSIAELWSTGRPSEHNPHPADGRPAALDITPGWCAPDEMADLYSYAQRARDAYAEKLMYMDGMWDLPVLELGAVGLPVVGPGEWLVAARDDFAAVYATVDPGNDDTGTWESAKPCHPVGGGIDPAFARLVVEDAMGRIGMNPRPRAGD